MDEAKRRTLDELAQAIVSKSKLSTVQRSVDRHIGELDFWLHGEGVRLQVVCDRLEAAGLSRPSGEPLTWRWLGALVARARKRAAGKRAPAPAPAASPPPAPLKESSRPSAQRDVSAILSPAVSGLESLVKKKPPPGG